MRYLIDTGALVRVLRRQVGAHWHEHMVRGLVAVCEPVVTETLAITGAHDCDRIEADLAALFPMIPLPGDAWDQMRALRRALAEHQAHTMPVAHYLLAVTGRSAGLTVLHESESFERVARVIPDFRQQRISRPPTPDDS